MRFSKYKKCMVREHAFIYLLPIFAADELGRVVGSLIFMTVTRLLIFINTCLQ